MVEIRPSDVQARRSTPQPPRVHSKWI
jgi:hypothetical protein